MVFCLWVMLNEFLKMVFSATPVSEARPAPISAQRRLRVSRRSLRRRTFDC